MASRGTITPIFRPILSLDNAEARHRVRSFYRVWRRHIPFIVQDYDLSKTVDECNAKLRSEFMKSKDITDIRAIDRLVIKGQLELKEIICLQADKSYLTKYWENDSPVTHHPSQFLSNFLVGRN